ncbi:MAG: hypothetical protein KDC46_08970 [Thermoleophilia bacterium]|nr:hypothetical protein [Thermoleophilia bacterium]
MRITGAPRRGIAARPARVPVLVLLAGTLLLLASLALLSARPARSASTSSTVVSATVPSATSLDISGCAADVSDVTDFGIVTPGSFSRTGTDCVVTFGSSNDAARLLTFQGDGAGDAMAAATSGGWDMDFDGNSGTGDGQVPESGAGDMGFYRDAQMAVDPRDGSIFTARPVPGGDRMMRVAKFTPTGVLDVTWDGPSGTGNGIVDYDILTPFADDWVQAITVQADGKVVIGFHAGSGFVVARMTTTGALDTSFGTGGVTDIPTSATDGDIQDITIDSQGRIYASGFRDLPTAQMMVARLRSDGVLDTGFGSGGIATTGGLLDVPNAYRVFIQPDGKVVLAGREWGGDQDFAFARFSSAGVLDTSLDGTGTTIVQATPGFDNVAFDAGYSDDGFITAVGKSATGQGVIVRIDAATGLPDPNFDGPSGTGNGVVLISPGGATTTVLNGVIVDPDGYITFAGSVTGGGDTDTVFGRMTPTGQWDTSFDGPSGTGDGWFTVDTAPGASDVAWDLQRATDGDVVAFVIEGASDTARLLRFDSTTIPDYAVGADDWTPGDSAFGMCLASLTGTGASITAAWTPDARCTNMGDSTNGTWWDDVPDNSGSPDAQVGSLSSTATDGSAHFRFGLRVAPNTPPGRYLAPITFQVVAP